jgi:AcrR family transcriptional regulator
MCPRPYRLGRRQAAAEDTRARILRAARALLVASGGFKGFSVDAVAREAGVSRVTVYNQFGSKIGLLEALLDSLAERGGIEQLGTVFQERVALDALDQFIAIFGQFWDSDRLVMRRLGGLVALDPDFEQVVRTRQGWKREGLRVLVRRLREEHGPLPFRSIEEAVDVLSPLTSFEMFDALAGAGRSPAQVVPLVQRLARAALGLDKPVRARHG